MTENKPKSLRCPSSGFCWRDMRHRCWHGIEVAVFCHEQHEAIKCPEMLEKWKARLEVK